MDKRKLISILILTASFLITVWAHQSPSVQPRTRAFAAGNISEKDKNDCGGVSGECQVGSTGKTNCSIGATLDNPGKAGTYQSGKCSGSADRRCCVPSAVAAPAAPAPAADQPCLALAGRCDEPSTLGGACAPLHPEAGVTGKYIAGKCGGGVNRRCCAPVAASTGTGGVPNPPPAAPAPKKANPDQVCADEGGVCQPGPASLAGKTCDVSGTAGTYVAKLCAYTAQRQCCVPGTKPAPAPAPKTAAKPLGFKSFEKYSLDCTDGFVGSATYNSPKNDPLKPKIRYQLEMDSSKPDGTATTKIVRESTLGNGETFAASKIVEKAAGKEVSFYITTLEKGADQNKDTYKHGQNAKGGVASANANDAASVKPYVLKCPVGTKAPPAPADTTTTDDGEDADIEDGTGRVNMKIEIIVSIPRKIVKDAGGAVQGIEPVVKTLPVEFSFIDNADSAKRYKKTVSMNYLTNMGRWKGTANVKMRPGSQYAVEVWGPKHAKKNICGNGPYNPHEMKPTTYVCDPDLGNIEFVAGKNSLDFARIALPPGDVKIDGKRDGELDVQDWKEVLSREGKTDAESIEIADLNFDGVVDQYDSGLIRWSISDLPR